VTSGYQAYQSNSVLTASPEQLVVMLYDGALRFSRRALMAWDNGDRGAATHAVGRVTAILNELNVTLDLEFGGEIAENLRSLYVFMVRYLTESVVENEPQKVRQVMGMLLELREAFAEASKTAGARVG
jgi:flagellar protein FliS